MCSVLFCIYLFFCQPEFVDRFCLYTSSLCKYFTLSSKQTTCLIHLYLLRHILCYVHTIHSFLFVVVNVVVVGGGVFSSSPLYSIWIVTSKSAQASSFQFSVFPSFAFCSSCHLPLATLYLMAKCTYIHKLFKSSTVLLFNCVFTSTNFIHLFYHRGNKRRSKMENESDRYAKREFWSLHFPFPWWFWFLMSE